MPIATFLHDRQPTRLRGLDFLRLSKTCTVLRGTAASDSGGGASMAWGTAGTAIPCRIDPLSAGRGQLTAGRVDERATQIVTLPATAGATVADRIAVSGGDTYEILFAPARTDATTVAYEAIALD